MLRLHHLGELPAWRDETVVYWLGEESLGRLLSRDLALTGTHPPLFYLVHYVWNHLMAPLGIAPGAAAVRLPSVLIGTLSIPLFYGMLGRCFGDRVAAIGATFLAVSPAHVAFSRTAKSEVLVVFFLIAVLGFAVRLLDRIENSVGAGENLSDLWRDRGFLALAVCYVFSADALLHTHSMGFIGLFLPSILFMDRFLNHRLAPSSVLTWTVVNLVAVAVFIPWLRLLLEISRSNTGYYWLAPVDINQVVSGILYVLFDVPAPQGDQTPLVARIGGALFAAVLVVVGCFRACRNDPRRRGIAAALVLLPALFLGVSLLKPVFLDYILMTMALPLIALLTGFALEAPSRGRGALATGLAALSLFLLPAEQQVYGGTPEPWDKVAAYLSEHAGDDDAVLFWPPLGEWSTRFYWRHDSSRWRTIDLGPGVDFQPLRTVPALPVAAVPEFVRNARRVWLVTDERIAPNAHALPELRATLSARLPFATSEQFASGLTVFSYSVEPSQAEKRP